MKLLYIFIKNSRTLLASNKSYHCFQCLVDKRGLSFSENKSGRRCTAPVSSLSVLPATSAPVLSDQDGSDDSSEADSLPDRVEEKRRLISHQAGLPFYAPIAASSEECTFRVHFPEKSPDFNRSRPRTVIIASDKGAVNPRIIVAKLQSLDIVPQQIQAQLNGDFAVTFKSVAEKDSFLASDYASRSPRHLSRPVWVRVNFKPAELKAGVVLDRMKEFGSILFHRENTHEHRDSLWNFNFQNEASKRNSQFHLYWSTLPRRPVCWSNGHLP